MDCQDPPVLCGGRLNMEPAVEEKQPSPKRPGHVRSTSSAVWKSFLPGSRNPSRSPKKVAPVEPSTQIYNDCILPSDHPHAQSHQVLAEINNSNQDAASPQKTQQGPSQQTVDDPFGPQDTMLSSNGTRKTSKAHFSPPKEKENTTPPRPQNVEEYTPIWAQFTSQQPKDLVPQDANRRDPLRQNPVTPYCLGRAGLSPSKGGDFYQAGRSPVRSPGDALKKPGEDTKARSAVKPENKPRVAQKTSYSFLPTRAKKEVQDDKYDESACQNASPLKQSKVLSTVARLNGTDLNGLKDDGSNERTLEGKDLDVAFEAVLAARNIPEQQKQNMRKLDIKIKQEFIKHDSRPHSASSRESASNKSFWDPFKSRNGRSRRRREECSADDTSFDDDKPISPTKRGRSRGRNFTFGKGDRSASKRPRSNSRPRSLMSLKNFSSTSVTTLDGSKDSKEPLTPAQQQTPDEFVAYLKTETKPEKLEVGKIHKLRLLLRNETVAWVDSFVSQGGMTVLVDIIRRIIKVEWREEHEDLLLHETLLCLKGLCTTRRALNELEMVQGPLFPELLKMLFDEERKGPSEFNTRGVIISLLFIYLSSSSASQLVPRARTILSYLRDPAPSEEERPFGFIEQMHHSRPYQLWCKEITNITKEVFWIFLHHLNVIALLQPSDFLPDDPMDSRLSYTARHFPRERPPVPAAPHVGGVEWEATNYIATHLDLLNGLIASVPTREERNNLRLDLRASGFEKTLSSLRLCKEKFYACVHDGLRTWVAAAAADGWEIKEVRQGASRPEDHSRSEVVDPKKKPCVGGGSPKKENVPKLELPVIEGAKRDEWLS